MTLNETPLLTCEVCGQGSHDPCVSKLVRSDTDTNERITPEQVQAAINPMKIPGINYMCGACENTTIPKPETGLLKKKSATTQSSEKGTETQTAEEPSNTQLQSKVQQKSKDPDENEVNPLNAIQLLLPDVQPASTREQGTSQPNNQTNNQVTSDQPKNQNQNTQTPTNTEQGQVKKDICRFYIKGTCRYGLRGNNCPYDHPQACKKLLNFGTSGNLGCDKGNTCSFYHPKMCQDSIMKQECYNNDCKLVHRKGTKRKPTYNKQETMAKETDQDNHSTFLEQAMMSLEKKIMKALDQKLAAVAETATSQRHYPSQPTERQTIATPHSTQQMPLWLMPSWMGQHQGLGQQFGLHPSHLYPQMMMMQHPIF